MERTDISVATFADHTQAEMAVKTLAQAGFDMRQLSIIGRGYHMQENVIGFYNAEGRIRFWGKLGAFWGSLWGLFAAGIFLISPVTGPIVALGQLAAVLLAAVEGAVAFGGASAAGAAMYSLGIPKDSVLEYERLLKADKFLVFVHGNAVDASHAKSILAAVNPVGLELYEGVTTPVLSSTKIAATG